MTQAQVIAKLLDHGPLTLREIVEISGVSSYARVSKVMCQMVLYGSAKRIKKGVYARA